MTRIQAWCCLKEDPSTAHPRPIHGQPFWRQVHRAVDDWFRNLSWDTYVRFHVNIWWLLLLISEYLKTHIVYDDDHNLNDTMLPLDQYEVNDILATVIINANDILVMLLFLTIFPSKEHNSIFI